jgi:acetyltransferase-like isoleucine patch superfamily enzyme
MIREGFIQEDDVIIGENLDTGYYVVVRVGACIGDNVCIWSHTTIDPRASIGDRVRIHNHCYVCQDAEIENDVFLGPGVRLLNDKYPPRFDPDVWEPPVIRKGAIIGGGAVICPSVVIGERAIIAAGAVVVRNVPSGQVWGGVPAKRMT